MNAITGYIKTIFLFISAAANYKSTSVRRNEDAILFRTPG